jgi:hypothetical protein
MKLRAKAFIATLMFLITALAMPLAACAASVPAQAGSLLSAEIPSASASNYEKAIDLKILGLMANDPANFELDHAPTRDQGVTMLVRLLGKEYEAQNGGYTHPFKDVQKWADGYVGYAYQNGIINGKTNDTFGAKDPLTANQFAAMVLRSLGYKDGVDFQYKQALDKAAEIGLLSRSEANELKNGSKFLRNDLVAISYNALKVNLKGSSRTLMEKLVDTDKAVFRPAAERLGLYTSDFERQYGDPASFLPSRTSYGYAIRNTDKLVLFIVKTLLDHTVSVEIDMSAFDGDIKEAFGPAFDKALEAAEEISGVENFVKERAYKSDFRTMKVTFTYRDTASVYNAKMENVKTALNKARHVVANLISAKMTDFEKEKILHDYIVNSTTYDYECHQRDTLSSDDAFEEYGCLVLGKAVCEGYSEAMKLLCDLAGVECMIIEGESIETAIGHAWNIIKIDGEYYHLDVTNDDAITGNGMEVLTYIYFNLTDSEMMKFNKWDTSLYPQCTSTRNNYYHKYSLVADSTEELGRFLTAAIEKHSPVFEVRVTNYSRNSFSYLAEMIKQSKVIRKYVCSINTDLGIIKIMDIEYFD